MAVLVHVLSAFFPLRTYIVSTFVSDYPKSVSEQNDCTDGDRVQTELRARAEQKQSPDSQAIVRSNRQEQRGNYTCSIRLVRQNGK